MDILSWTPIVTRITRPKEKQQPRFSVRAELRCIICGEVAAITSHQVWMIKHKVEGSRVDATDPSGLDMVYIGQAVSFIKGQRSCDVCGVMSVVPPRQVKELEAQMRQKLNVEWMESQLAAVPVKAPINLTEHQITAVL